jgi:hypothetical protein
LLRFFSLPEILNVEFVFQFFLSFFIKFFSIPIIFRFLRKEFLGDIVFGDIGHGEVEILVAFKADTIVPVEVIELFKSEFFTH